MEILHISDTHNRHNKLELIPTDILVHSGDFSGTGQPSEVQNFMKWFIKYPAKYKVLVAGNHDISFDSAKWEDGNMPAWLKSLMEGYLSVSENFYLENSSCKIEDIRLWGSPVTPRFGSPRWAFNVNRGSDIRKIWETIPGGTDVVITHGPVKGILDYIPEDNFNAGCVDLGEILNRIKPRLHLSGHIHEGYGNFYDETSNITYSNASICNMRYEPVNKPIKHKYDL